MISLQSFEHFDIISVVCSVYNMENCDICFSACFAVKRLLFEKKRARDREKQFLPSWLQFHRLIALEH